MTESQQKAWDRHADRYLIEVPELLSTGVVPPREPLDLAAIFGREADLIVEIGPGMGESLVPMAAARPEANVLAFEVYRAGAAGIIHKASTSGEHGISNVRVLMADAASGFTQLLPTDSISELWTFFPDPWPKTKHHKRRLVQPDFADRVADLLEPEGNWRLATDWADYAWQFRDVVEGCPGLINPYAGRLADPGDVDVDPRGDHGGFAPRFDGRVETRFERKGLAVGRIVRDVLGVRPTH